MLSNLFLWHWQSKISWSVCNFQFFSNKSNICEYMSLHKECMLDLLQQIRRHIQWQWKKSFLNIDIRCQSYQTFHHWQGKISWSVCTCQYYQASLTFVGKAMSPLPLYSLYFIHVLKVNDKETILNKWIIFKLLKPFVLLTITNFLMY